MKMAVNESGHQRAPLPLDDSRARPAPALGRLCAPDEDDALAANSNGFGVRVVRVSREDAGVSDEAVGGLGHRQNLRIEGMRQL